MNKTFLNRLLAHGFVETYYPKHENEFRELAFYAKTTRASSHPSLSGWIAQDCIDADAVVITEVCPDGRVQRVIKDHDDAFFTNATPTTTEPGLTVLAEAMAAEAIQ